MKRACPCGTPIEPRNQSGMCRPCFTAHRNAPIIPPDFAERAARTDNTALCQHYGISMHVLARWRRTTGIKPPSRVRGSAIPQSFRLAAQAMTHRQLAEHFGRGKLAISAWCKHLGIKPVPEKRVYHAPHVVGRADRAFHRTTPVIRDETRIGRAVDFLRHYGPLYRCGPGGAAMTKGLHWNRNGFVLTDAEVIERAVRLGWDADSWKRVA